MIEENKIYCGDCLEIMKKIKTESIDLTITSPPYDSLRDYDGFDFDFDGIANELFRLTKKGAYVVWIVNDGTEGGSETLTSFKQAIKFNEIGFRVHDTMIYQKSSFSNPEINRYHATFEYMFVLSKGKPGTFNPIKDRPNKHAGKQIHGTFRLPDGSLQPVGGKGKIIKEFGMRHNVWLYNNAFMQGQSDKIAYEHPATFPEQLVRDHILSWTNENDLVFDPMIGSGTTALMAKELKRNYIGCEISWEYCKLAERRLISSNQ